MNGFSYARPEDAPALREIWRCSFDDEAAYIDFFFQNRFCPARTAIWREDGRPVGMAHLLPARLGGRAALYGYAVAVLPAYRGRGIASALQRCVMEENRDKVYFVRPASQELELFYEKLGLSRCLFKKMVSLRAWYGALPACAPLCADTLCVLRRTVFGDAGVQWDETAVAYALRENVFCGGMNLLLDGCALLILPQGKVLHVRETTLPDSKIADYVPALAARLGCEAAVLHLTEQSGLAGESFCVGMAAGMPERFRGYLGLALD